MKNFIICILSIAVVGLAYQNYNLSKLAYKPKHTSKKIYSFSQKTDARTPVNNNARNTNNRGSLRQIEGSLKKTF